RMRETARTLYKIYIALTVVEAGLLLCGGLPLYDALVTAFGTAGTGGFSVLAESIGGYGSAYVEIVTAVFMLLFGINFNLYYIALIRRSIRGFKSQELYCYLLIIVFATVTIGLNISAQYGGFIQSLRYSFFQVTAIISSTGYATADFNLWPAYSRTLLLMLMLVGACAGSTGGGMKMSRCMIAAKAAGQELHRQLFPRSVNRVTLDGERIGTETIRSTLIYLLLYALLVIGGSLLLSLNGLDLETTVTSVISCLSNIGPGLGLVGPMGSFAVWSQASKLLLCLFMIMGRLEIFPVILMFTPNVWYSSQKRAGRRHGRLHRGE
ncbi:MAG: TrkH family potassium uptake protein, partial [Oscillospiraceae bacterium]|nr:TrkH family potassium uptake protein [Oscillospiraceae bacterium]